MSAIETYAARFDAFNAQRERFYGQQLRGEPAPRFAAGAGRARLDPRRQLDPQSEIIASYVQPDDVVVDVGGGAGRLTLPLALRCREAVNVDLSATLEEQFTNAAQEADITNARFVRGDWLEVEGIEGDLVLMANVTYFVRDIAAFIQRWQPAARRRVLVFVSTLSSRDQDAALFRAVFDEELQPAPAFRELLPALWEMDIFPDVRLLPAGGRRDGSLPATKEEAVQWALQLLPTDPPAGGGGRVEARFQELFTETPEGFRPLWRPRVRDLLVAWEPERG